MKFLRLARLSAAGLWFAAAWIAGAQFQAGQTMSKFRVPDYDDAGELKSLVLGEEATALTETLIRINGLRLELYRQGVLETRVTSPVCVFDRASNSASSTSSVRIARGNLVITGEQYTWETQTQRFVIERNARVVIQGKGKEKARSLFPGGAP
jgi:hypothetical protein